MEYEEDGDETDADDGLEYEDVEGSGVVTALDVEGVAPQAAVPAGHGRNAQPFAGARLTYDWTVVPTQQECTSCGHCVPMLDVEEDDP